MTVATACDQFTQECGKPGVSFTYRYIYIYMFMSMIIMNYGWWVVCKCFYFLCYSTEVTEGHADSL